jgi:hypothetical protein
VKRNKKIVYLVLLALALIGIHFFLQKDYIGGQNAPKNNTENTPPAETTILNGEGDKDSLKANDKQPTLVPKTGFENKNKMELSPVPISVSQREPVNLEKHSYSIKNEKKEIKLTPGVSFQPGKSITVKIPGEEEVIKVKRDKIYHPDSLNMLWEKKY